MLPFSWSGVSLQAEGPKELRAQISAPAQGAVSLEIADAAGAPLASVGSLALRPFDPAQAQAASAARGTGLLALELEERRAGRSRQRSPTTELLRIETDGEGPERRPQGDRAGPGGDPGPARRPRRRLPPHLPDPGAMAAREGESPDPVTAAIWGLVRSAGSEHPGRFALIDTDGIGGIRGRPWVRPWRSGPRSPSSPCARAGRSVPRLARLEAAEARRRRRPPRSTPGAPS